MSDKQGKGRRKGSFLPSLVFITTGFFAGFYGIDFVISNSEASKTDATSGSALSLDALVTASIGEDRWQQVRNKMAALFSSSDAPADSGDGFAVASAFASAETALAVERGGKANRTGSKPPANKVATIGTGGNSVPLHKAKPMKIGPRPRANAEPGKAAEASKPAAAQSQSAAAEVASQVSAVGVEVVKKLAVAEEPMAPSRAVAVQPPYADAADVALFAADMPLPAKLTVGKGDSTVPSYYSPLVPRTFDNGKAFGGLDEEEFQRRERRCMVTALYFEARSESDEGQIAVGQVIMNRVKSPDYPDTICGVVYQGSDRRTGCQFSFTCDGRPDRPQDKAEWERSIYLANLVLEGKVWLKAIGESTHYHANYVNPAWRREMDRKKKVGHHIFYRSPEVSITAPYQLVGDEKRS